MSSLELAKVWLRESRSGPEAETAFLDGVSVRDLELADLSGDDVSRMRP